MSLADRLMGRLARIHAAGATRRFLRAAERTADSQQHLLKGLLERNAGSAFGRDHGFDGIRDAASYVQRVPIRNYRELQPYVRRVFDGDVGALFGGRQPILMFAMTSGTTAEPKYVPITPRALADWKQGWNIWGLKALLDHPQCILRGILQITSPMQDRLSPTGIPCGAITGLLAATQKRLVRRYYVAPALLAGIKDPAAKYYTIMRLAVPGDVSFLVTANPATLLLLARTADERREQLIRDVCDGTLNAALPVDNAIREAIRPCLTPQPEIARRLERLVEQHGMLAPKHYWRLGFLAHWTGGTMGLYGSQLPRWFGDIPSRDIGLLASEGRMTIPVDDGTAAGVLAVGSQYFEFIPASQYGGESPSALRAEEVRPGEEYFLVVSNNSGLYRYDLGDRVRIVGHRHGAPLVEFLSRDDHTASMAGEKLTEDQVVTAMRRMCGDGDQSIVDFVLAPIWNETPYYRLYIEPRASQGEPMLAERFDAALRDINIEYASKRDTLRLGPIVCGVLTAGTLAERQRRQRLQRSHTAEQFKHQYLLPRPGLDDDLVLSILPSPTFAR